MFVLGQKWICALPQALRAWKISCEKMEALLPFNVKTEELDAARTIPELIYPEKMKWPRPIYQTASIMLHN